MKTAVAIASSWTNTLKDWLHRPENVHGRWLGKMPVRVAWLGLLLAAICPPHGSGISLCALQHWTGIPCPGCGITRSMSCGLHGMFVESWNYHPFGLFILALFLVTAFTSLLPQSRQQQLARAMESRALIFNSLYLSFVMLFITYGATRALLHLARFCGL